MKQRGSARRCGRAAVRTDYGESTPMSKEKPNDDPRQQTDWKNTKQTDQPWKGPVEKEQKPGGPPARSGKMARYQHALIGADHGYRNRTKTGGFDDCSIIIARGCLR